MSEPLIPIYVGTTSIRVPCSRNGMVAPGIYLGTFVRNFLEEREWDPKLRAMISVNRFTDYDDATGCALLPRMTLDAFKRYLGEARVVEYELPAVSPRTVNIRMKKKIEPRAEQVPIVEFMSDPDNSYKPVSAGCGEGKGVSTSEPIKVPGGWKPAGELKVGDTVTAWDGTPSKVTGVFPQGVKQLYRVYFRDGRYLDTDDVHLWTVMSRDKDSRIHNYHYDFTSDDLNREYLLPNINAQNIGIESTKLSSDLMGTHFLDDHSQYTTKVMSTFEILSKLQTPNARLYIPHHKSEQLSDVDLPIHPYVLGALLGDGSLSTKGNFSLSTDNWIVNKVFDLLGVECTGYYHSGCYIGNFPKLKCKNVYDAIETLGLADHKAWEKFIPKIYLEGSHQQRLELLQGLMDTDGFAGKDGVGRNGVLHEKTSNNEYSTTSKQLALDVQYLARSLGAECTVTERTTFYTYNGVKKAGRLSYRVRIRYPWMSEFFSLPRKKERMKDNNQYAHNWKNRIMSVHPLLEKDECVCIAIDHPDKLYITHDFVVTHNTVMSIFTAASLQTTTLIVLSFLIEQWYKSLREFTRLATHEIYVVQGHGSLKKLWEMADNGYRPKVIIFSARTLFLYGVEKAENYKEFRSYAEFQKVFGIGLKVMDEIHLGFNTNVRIDLVSNISHNVYLSATYMRNSPSGRKIFDLIYPENMRYGTGNKAKHVNCFMFEYSLGIFPSEISRFKLPKGYNHALYENYLRRKNAYLSPFFYKVILPIINRHYLEKRKPGQRLLILTQTKKFAIELCTFLKPQMPMEEINLFFSNEAKHGNPKNLLSDIIISTNKSCGVGRDIKGLKTCINTISFASEPLALQMFGRLRPIPGEETIYIDMWNRDVPSHDYHHTKRAQAYRSKAATYLATTI